MSTFGSILSIARTAILAHQTAVDVISQNVANAETEGYSRQRAELAASPPQQFGFGSVGTGVQVANVVRLRESLLDSAYRREAASAEGFSLRREVMTQIEGIFGEPSDQAMSNALDAFWSSWGDLANNPSSAGAQSLVRQRGAEVASTLNRFSSRLGDIETSIADRLTNSVNEVNRLAAQLADLNGQITSAEVAGTQAPDLRDSRDRVADQLSKLAGARVLQQNNGTYAFLIGGVSITDGVTARPIELRAGIPASLGLVGGTDALPQAGGALGEMLTLLNTDVPDIRSRLDQLAKGLVNGVNYMHASGWTAAGDALGNANWNVATPPIGSRVNFFDPAKTTAATISISAEVAASATVIASGTTQNAPGDNSLALAMAGLRTTSGITALQTSMGAAAFAAQVGLTGSDTYGDSFRGTVTNVGLRVREADNSATVYSTLADQAENRRSSASGVSIDEELTLLLRHQQAFQAASRLVTTADEMARTLLDMMAR
jgi:flagellar hook-associated protein 1 FlgK